MGDRQMQAARYLLLLYSIDYDYMYYDKIYFTIKKIM
jgi:hypothetical protein